MGQLFAQNETDTTKARTLKEVQINANRISNINKSATPVQVLKGTELEKLNSFSVADAIRYFSGAQVKDYGGVGGLKTINVRSLGSNHVGVFYDGIEFGNSQNGQVDLGKFSLDNIEEIGLYNAQKSNIFQSAKGYSSGSAIYLSSKQPIFAEGSNWAGKISFKTGSFGLVNPAFILQRRISKKISAFISSEYIGADGRYKFRYTNSVYDTTAIRQNGDLQAQRVEAGISGKLKDSSNWNVKGYLYHSERGLPRAIVGNRFESKQRQTDRNEFVQGSYNFQPTARYSLILSAKYADDKTRYFDPEITTTRGLLENSYYEHELYFSAANRYHINSFWDVAVSADYQRNTLDATENDSAQYRFVHPLRNTVLLAAATAFHFPRLDIQANLLSTFVDDKVEVYTAAGKKQEFTPAVLLSWQPTSNPNLRLRAFYKSIFRLPTFNDLYFTFIGSSFLRPEYTEQYNFGITYTKYHSDQLLSYFAVQSDAYYNTVKDKIVAVPGQNLLRWTMENLGRVKIKGLELNSQASWRLANALLLQTGISYTYQQAIDVTDKSNIFYGDQIAYAPKHCGTLLVGVDWEKLGFNYSFVYVGERYSQKTNIGSNYLQPWYTHDAGLSYRTNFHQQKIKLTVEVNNVFNQYYDVIINFPMPGRNYRLTLSTSF